jgi:type IV secretion system protein VirB9
VIKHLPFITALFTPALALAQQPSVPALDQAAVSSQPGITAEARAAVHADTPTLAAGNTPTQTVKIPDGWPPMEAKIQAPALPLNNKEANALNQATQWRNKYDHATLDADGVSRWVFGNSQTPVTCAPLNICDVELKPGETINNIRLGDTAFWNVTLAVSGSPSGRVTHIALTPREAGRQASMLVYTDERIYQIKLISTATKYTPRTGFVYPDASADNLQATLAAYHDAVGYGNSASANENSPGNIANIQQLAIKGDTRVPWAPTNAYTDGKKTYIVFPHNIQFGQSPVILALNNDAGWFSSASERRVIYRWMSSDRVAIDASGMKFELILGVGSSQQKIILEAH